MGKIQTATCQDCGWTGPVEDTKEFRHLYERVHPGDVMPAGDCPEEGCGGAAMLDEEHNGEDDLRPPMVAGSVAKSGWLVTCLRDLERGVEA